MPRSFILVTVLLSSALQAGVSHAQLRGFGAPPATREPARVGLLGGIREAREERFKREEQAATAAARAAAAQRNAAASARPNPNVAAQQANPYNLNRATAGVAPNSTLRRGITPPSNPSLSPSQRSVESDRAGNVGRTSNYGGSNLAAANRNSAGVYNPNASVNPNRGNEALMRPSVVAPASSATLIPNPVRYDGPGVAIRLPRNAPTVVNYLVDDVEKNVLQPGEQQVFDSKASYIVRYSRGVTADGRSFGESRYTISEGRYRFELTESGWELYRETDAETPVVPENRLEIAENFASPSSLPGFTLPSPTVTQEIEELKPSINGSKPSEPAISEPAISEPAKSEPAKSDPATEEVLPAPKPRSILE